MYEVVSPLYRPPKYSFWRISTWPCSSKRKAKKERKKTEALLERDRREFNEALRESRVPVPVPVPVRVPVERRRLSTSVVETTYPEPYETPYGTVYPKPITRRVSGGQPVYAQSAPVYTAPAPVYASPASVYASPAPVYQQPVYAQQPVQQAPQPVYVNQPAPVYINQAPPAAQVIQLEAARPQIITANGQRYEIPENSKVTYRKTYAPGSVFAPGPRKSAGVPAVTAVQPVATAIQPTATAFASVAPSPTMGQHQVITPAALRAPPAQSVTTQSRPPAPPASHSARSSRWLHPPVGPAHPERHYPLVENALATMWGDQDSASEGVRRWRDNAALRAEERASRLAKCGCGESGWGCQLTRPAPQQCKRITPR